MSDKRRLRRLLEFVRMWISFVPYRYLNSMIEIVQRTVAGVLNCVRVNRILTDISNGVPVFVKQRRRGGQIAIWFANRFLALAGSGTLVEADGWTDWEVHCVRLLYPERAAVEVGPGPAVIMPKVSGISLRQLLQRGDADLTTAFVLAARELQRVHQIHCSYYNAGWSHGDLHLDNILCDLDRERAALIDFDTRHEFGAGQTQRQADDLRTVLLELIGLPDERWLPAAAAFIAEYGDASVLGELTRHLFVPRGFARILFYIKTNSSSIRRIEPRLEKLIGIIKVL